MKNKSIFEEFVYQNEPRLDHVNLNRILKMRQMLQKGQKLQILDQIELVDFSVEGVKAMKMRNDVYDRLLEKQNIIKECKVIILSALKKEENTKVLIRLLETMGRFSMEDDL